MSKNVIIIGGGFGGLAAARALKNTDLHITLIDKNSQHIFLPLLYQVATAVLSPSDVSVPIRELLRQQKNARVVMACVERIDLQTRQVHAGGQQYGFDYLIVACGLRSSYFGKDVWEETSPSLKTIADAVKIREKILLSLEKAECQCSAEKRQKTLTFVVVGGGPTGVEVAGALVDIKRLMLRDFKQAQAREVRIILLEVMDRILCSFSPALSAKGKEALEAMGVEVRLNTQISDINTDGIQTDNGFIETENVIWAAGARSQVFMQSLNTETDKSGRVMVDSFCCLKNHRNVCVIGDAAVFMHAGKPLPSLAPVAIQQGKYVSGIIKRDLRGNKRQPFEYKDKGSIAIIGRHEAVLQHGRCRMWGYPAWLLWMLLHVSVISQLRNRCSVLSQWLWFHTTGRHGARLITR